MKSFLEITADEKKRMLRWALLNDRADMWNERGAFMSQKCAAYLFRLGLETVEQKRL